MLSKGNFQPPIPRMKEEKFHLQPWNWPWKKQTQLCPAERLQWGMNHTHTNSPLVTVRLFIPRFLTWTKLCILRTKPDPHLGFKWKAKGTEVIPPQHHLPNAALGSDAASSVLHMIFIFSSKITKWQCQNQYLFRYHMLLLYSLNKKLFPLYTNATLPWSCYSKSLKADFHVC